jgi:hypothetical protein
MVADTSFVLFFLHPLFLEDYFISLDLAWVNGPREMIIGALFQFRVDLRLLFGLLNSGLNQNFVGACRATLFDRDA